MSNPYPNLRKVALKPHPAYLHGSHLAATLRVCENVRRRTGEIAWFDVPRRQVCFGHELAEVGLPRIVVSVPLFDGSRANRFDPSVGDEWDEDTIVRFIGYSRATAEEKQRWTDAKSRSRRNDEAQAEGLATQQSAEQAIKHVDAAYERYSMGRHYRKTVSVKG